MGAVEVVFLHGRLKRPAIPRTSQFHFLIQSQAVRGRAPGSPGLTILYAAFGSPRRDLSSRTAILEGQTASQPRTIFGHVFRIAVAYRRSLPRD